MLRRMVPCRDEVLDAEHLAKHWIRKVVGIDWVLGPMCGGGPDLLADECRDIDAGARTIVCPFLRRQKSDPIELGAVGGSIGGDRRWCGKRQGRHVVECDDMRVSGLARCDALFSDKFPRARLIDHPYMAVVALSPDFHISGEKKMHLARGIALFDEIKAGREPLDVDKIGGVSERCCFT